MRYCFRHSDALWYWSVRALVVVFAVVTLWVVGAGLLGDRASGQQTQAPQTMVAPGQSADGNVQFAGGPGVPPPGGPSGV